LQAVSSDVQHARMAAKWLQRNLSTFAGNVEIPLAATFDDHEVDNWTSSGDNNDVAYQQYRDATLFNFNDAEDIRLFIKLIGGLRIPVNVCLNGSEYIANNAYVW